MDDILIFCSGDQARVIADIIAVGDEYRLRGFTDDRPDLRGTTVRGYPVLGAIDDLPKLGIRAGIVGLGDNHHRAQIVERVTTLVPGFRFVTAIHPFSAIARDVEIGAGSVVMAGCTINTGSQLGTHTIVNTHCSIDHDGRMDDFSSLAPGVVCGGHVTIGAGSAVGLGASIVHGVTIGPESVIGAGAVVLASVPPDRVAYGNPCRIVRERVPGDRYL